MGVAKLVKSFEFHQLSLKRPNFPSATDQHRFAQMQNKIRVNLCASVAKIGFGFKFSRVPMASRLAR